MDKKIVKNFAISSRIKLREGIITKLAKLGITNKEIEEAIKIGNDTIEIPSNHERYSGKDVINRNKLIENLNKRCKVIETNSKNAFGIAFDNLVEEVAYTWFNRLIAIRFMEVNDYLPGHMRILSSEIPTKREPDIITNLLDTDLFLKFDVNTQNKIRNLISDGSAQAVDELYLLVFIKSCNVLNELLPDLFEKIDDYSELLFTVSYIDENDVIASLLTIPEEYFNVKQGGQVEIIGWMYQYYNTEPKDKVFARGNRKIRADEIPAATQLFTPDWIVKYMVENSLGRYYIDQKLANPLENRTEKEIADQFGWEYYIPSAEQPEDVQLQIADERKDKSVISLQELKLMDPSMGSGHILVYAFDVFMQLYINEGYRERDAVDIILENNLFGLDIDKRAFQLAYFALMMKGREYSRRFLSKGIHPNVYVIPDNEGITIDDLKLLNHPFTDPAKANEDLIELINAFKYGSELGSLIQFKNIDFYNLESGFKNGEATFIDYSIIKLIKVGKLLQEYFDIVITNPPYLPSSAMNKVLSELVNKMYPNSKGDLFAIFIDRVMNMTKHNGYFSMITQQVWMFISSYKKLRTKITQQSIINMLHLGTRAFEELKGEKVQTVAFTISPSEYSNYISSFIRLVDFANANLKEQKTLTAINNRHESYFYQTSKNNFNNIQGSPISYWASENTFEIFSSQMKISDVYTTRAGMITGNNSLFMRNWHEIYFSNFGINIMDRNQAIDSNKKWFPYSKGGEFRRWYGNNEYVVNWENDGYYMRNLKNINGKIPAHAFNLNYIFKPQITWSSISSGSFSARFCPNGFLFDASGSFADVPAQERKKVLAYLNSKVAGYFLNILNPTLNFQKGNIDSLPLVEVDNEKITEISNNNIILSNNDWNSYEESWNFSKHPLI